MRENLTDNENIILSINCDGIGLENSKTAISLMELSDKIKIFIKRMLTERSSIEVIDPWTEKQGRNSKVFSLKSNSCK